MSKLGLYVSRFTGSRTVVRLLIASIALLVVGAAVAGWLWFGCLCSTVAGGHDTTLLIDRDDTQDSVCAKLDANAIGWSLLCRFRPMHLRTGRYVIPAGSRLYDVYSRIRIRQQDAVRITIPTVRHAGDYAERLSAALMIDAQELAEALADSTLIDSLGFTAETFPAMFIPDTYEVWWTTSARDLLCRLHREWQSYWNAERTSLATAIGLTPVQVSTLASIVESETANDSEKATIAGLYINRLHRGILLQSDPTVIFAMGDFTVRRVLQRDLDIDSPYNTYRFPGLPPGPIRIPSRTGLEAVLHYAHHDYLYMCAKEDFSGTHNFARTLSEHLANARRYTAALNSRGIRR